MSEVKQINRMLIIGLKLALICAISGLSLGALNIVTDKAKRENRKMEETETLKKLIPGGIPGYKVEVDPGDLPEGQRAVKAYYPVRMPDEGTCYILILGGRGYGGAMEIMAAYKPDGEVLAVKLMVNNETPGLGKKAESDAYMRKFIGRGGEGNPIPLTKEMLVQTGPAAAFNTEREWWEFQAADAAELFFGKSAGDTDSVTGATITFTGVSRALAAGSDFVKTKWGK